MENVILYCRVSTDEQGEGASLDQQERFLRAYCNNRGYNIIGKPYKEEYSAKGYVLNRPEFKKVYDYCRHHRTEVQKVLFLRWDRYSRNVEFAFAYKRKFIDELGIEINALESPIDFNSGDWAILLALYCGTAHSEDVKISKRTKDGIHGTLLKGKWCGRAPRGYKNQRRAKHDCWIEIDKPKAEVISKVFNELAKGVETLASIRRRICPEISDNTLRDMVRNPFYAGLVFVPAYNGEKEHYVQGQHEAIIDKATFDKVQSIIDKNKPHTPKLSKPVCPKLYLRKFLFCPICGHALTGAYCKGNGGKYPYYFCNYDHKHLNVRAENVNIGFVEFVSKLKPNKAILALYNEILLDIKGEQVKANNEQADKLEESIVALKKRIDKVNDLFIDGELTKEEKEQDIERYRSDINKIQNQVDALRLKGNSQIKDKIKYSVNLIGNMGEFFNTAIPEVKIKLLGSIFPEKIEFDGKNYRTKSYNKMLDLIFKETKHLQGHKKAESSENSENPACVPQAGVEPARRLMDTGF